MTQADVDAAEADVQTYNARIAASRAADRAWPSGRSSVERANLDNTIIRAPFTGVAISKDAQPGEMVSPISAGGGFTRTGICTIVDMESLEIEVDVNESYINRVAHEPAGDGRARRLPGLADPGACHHDRARRRTGRRRRCWCASASSSSTRGSCPTWA